MLFLYLQVISSILSKVNPLLSPAPIRKNALPESFSSKFLIFDFYSIDQSYIDNVLANYSSMRKFHNRPPTFATHIIGAATIATHLNLSLLSRRSATQEQFLGNPSVFLVVSLFDSNGRTAKELWDKYRHNNRMDKLSESPEFFQVQPSDFNFVYCDTLRQTEENPFGFTAFSAPFDFVVWICLAISMTIIAILVTSDFHSIGFQFQPLPILSSLVTPGLVWTSSKMEQKLQYSGLFLLWISCGSILVDFYTGAVTSFLISPSEGNPMTKLEHLVERNYTLIFDSLVRLTLVNATMQSYFPLLKNAKQNVNTNIQVLANLIYTISASSSGPVFPENEFIEKIATGGKFASLVGWPYALLIATKANEHIILSSSSETSRSCIVGKELISAGPVFHVVLPPGSSRASEIHARYIASGLHNLWAKEFYGNAYSSRVQDRSKVVSPTQITSAYTQYGYNESRVELLKLKGNIEKIFALWLLCVLVCTLSFLIEVVYKKLSIRLK